MGCQGNAPTCYRSMKAHGGPLVDATAYDHSNLVHGRADLVARYIAGLSIHCTHAYIDMCVFSYVIYSSCCLCLHLQMISHPPLKLEDLSSRLKHSARTDQRHYDAEPHDEVSRGFELGPYSPRRTYHLGYWSPAGPICFLGDLFPFLRSLEHWFQ